MSAKKSTATKAAQKAAKKAVENGYSVDADGVPDFSEDPSDPIPFHAGLKPDVEQYFAIGDAPGGMFLDLAEVASSDNTAETVKAVSEFFSNVLTDDSSKGFLERLNDNKKPIPLKQALKIFEWLVEIYSGEADRPTQGPSSSPGGSETTGRSSTARARSRATIPSVED